MKIAIDGRWIFPEISGIGNYTRQLLGELARQDLPESFLVLFSDPAVMERTVAETGLEGVDHIEPRCVPWGVFSIQSQLKLPGFLKREKVDLFHSPNYMIPFMAFPRSRSGRIKCIATIHDVIPLIFPHHAPRSRKSKLFPLYKRLMLEVGQRTSMIITDSKASRRDIIKHLHIRPEQEDKVVAIYCGVDDAYHGIERQPSTDERRLLYVGRSDPYKNIDTLLRAFADVKERHALPVRLDIAGSPDPRYPGPQELARELEITDSVHWCGYLTDDELLDLYARADVLVHPSRYEGFGLQIIEAMACGLPVVCGNGGSCPEVAGDAGIVVDCDDTAGFTRAILEVLEMPDRKKGMIEKGKLWAQNFTWEKTAQETLNVYRRALIEEDEGKKES
jgi:glycosyltransferase involved in cell wall biosynthesis